MAFVAWKALGKSGVGEITDPTIGLGEEADGGEARRGTHVEPVLGAVRNTDQILGLTEDFVDAVFDMEGEKAGATDEEAHFIFLMAVLAQEFRAHGFAFGMVGIDADHIDGAETVLRYQLVDFRLVGCKNRFVAGIVGNRTDRPAFKTDPDCFKLCGDDDGITALEKYGIGGGFGKYA